MSKNTFNPDYICNHPECKERINDIVKEYQECYTGLENKYEKLKEYTQHKSDCIKCRHSSIGDKYWIDPERKCDCGLDDLLRGIE